MSSEPDQRFVRQFVLVKGRGQSASGPLPLDSLVTAAGIHPVAGLAPEQLDVLDLCSRPLSIAEIGAHLGVHLGIARVLVGDLITAGLVSVSKGLNDDLGPDLSVLERLFNELSAY